MSNEKTPVTPAAKPATTTATTPAAKPVAKRTVKINENDLVDLIDNIVNEAVEIKKKEWLNEQATKSAETPNLLEARVKDLEEKIKSLTEGKK